MSTSKNLISIFEQMLWVLKTIGSRPAITTSEIHAEVLGDMSLRSAQRYLERLESGGYISREDIHRKDAQFFLTEKSKQLFGEVMA